MRKQTGAIGAVHDIAGDNHVIRSCAAAVQRSSLFAATIEKSIQRMHKSQSEYLPHEYSKTWQAAMQSAAFIATFAARTFQRELHGTCARTMDFTERLILAYLHHKVANIGPIKT